MILKIVMLSYKNILSVLYSSIITVLFIHYMYHEQCPTLYLYSFLIILYFPLIFSRSKRFFLSEFLSLVLGFFLTFFLMSNYLEINLYPYYLLQLSISSVPVLALYFFIYFLRRKYRNKEAEKPIEFYKSQEEKESAFEYKKIDTKDKLMELLKEYKNYDAKNPCSNNLIFRGMNNSSYKLYNSAQVDNLKSNSIMNFKKYHKEINKNITQAKGESNNLLETFFKQIGNGKDVHDLSVMCFLRHYGKPTPILDWTHSFLLALFFAKDGYTPQNDEGLEKYISIYLIDTKCSHSTNELINVSNYYKIAQDNLEYAKEMATSENPKVKIDSTETDNKVYKLPYLNSINNIKVGFMSDWVKSELKLHINNNLNIIAQQGAFIYNGVYPKSWTPS